MECKTCPYICEDGYCEKINGMVTDYTCYEVSKQMEKSSYENSSKLNRYERNQKYKRKLKRIADNPTRYPAGAYYHLHTSYVYAPSTVTYNQWVKENWDYVKRYYRANHAPGWSGYLKKLASRRFRRYKGELANGCAYKKTFDYWWELT